MVQVYTLVVQGHCIQLCHHGNFHALMATGDSLMGIWKSRKWKQKWKWKTEMETLAQ